MIKSNKADLMVCGGAEAAICPLGISGFSAARALCDTFNDNQNNASNGLTEPVPWPVPKPIASPKSKQRGRSMENIDNKDKFISSGLWAYSRHPNYFGEILLWLGIAVMSFSSLEGFQYFTLISPIFVYRLTVPLYSPSIIS